MLQGPVGLPGEPGRAGDSGPRVSDSTRQHPRHTTPHHTTSHHTTPLATVDRTLEQSEPEMAR